LSHGVSAAPVTAPQTRDLIAASVDHGFQNAAVHAPTAAVAADDDTIEATNPAAVADLIPAFPSRYVSPVFVHRSDLSTVMDSWLRRASHDF
jgi:hypothetical protein